LAPPDAGQTLTGTPDEVIQQLRDWEGGGTIAAFRLAANQLVAVNHLLELAGHPQWTPHQIKASFLVQAEPPEVVRLDYTGTPKRFQRFRGTIVPFLVEALRQHWQAQVMLTLTYQADQAGYSLSDLVAWLQQVLGAKAGQISLTLVNHEDAP
jgi:hypothetical protein